MTKEQITNYVVDICSEMLVCNKDDVKLNSDLVEDLGADDLDFIELIMNCETEFNIGIYESDAAKINTVGDLVDIVCAKLNL